MLYAGPKIIPQKLVELPSYHDLIWQQVMIEIASLLVSNR